MQGNQEKEERQAHQRRSWEDRERPKNNLTMGGHSLDMSGKDFVL